MSRIGFRQVRYRRLREEVHEEAAYADFSPYINENADSAEDKMPIVPRRFSGQLFTLAFLLLDVRQF